MLIALDAGTTSVRAVAFDEASRALGSETVVLPPSYPRPGWVEHDPVAIWQACRRVLHDLRLRFPGPVAALGLTNQRETALAWDRDNGSPLSNAIVWQDRRGAAQCEQLAMLGNSERIRSMTGLLLDPYFSATKFSWLLGEGGVARVPGLVLSTLDSWLAWNLTGGREGGVVVSDPSNASRTLCYDLAERGWSEELCQIFGVPIHCLPEIVPSCGRLGRVAHDAVGPLEGVPLSAAAGDQQSALFGQACFDPGVVKCTYGTGSFVLTPCGDTPPPAPEGLLVSVAWDLGDRGGLDYVLEGSAFWTGATLEWLVNGLGIAEDVVELEELARSVPDAGGSHLVPAFSGLGSPWWDPHARGALVGVSRGVGRAQVARAGLESIAYQVRDITDAMANAGVVISSLRADGGASVSDLLLQVQSDQLGVPVTRSEAQATARGAALLAGLAEGLWEDIDQLESLWRAGETFEPKITRSGATSRQEAWRRSVARSRDWARA